MQLRDYQIDCQTAIKDSFDKGVNRQLVALPTGTGKTVIFAGLPQTLGVSKAIVLAPREELLDQARDKIQAVNPDLRVEVEQADRHASAWADIVVASVATIGRKDSPRIERFDPASYPLIICDEAHHCHHALAHIAMMGYNKRIQDVQIGELVKCWDGRKTVYRPIVNKFVYPSPTFMVKVLTQSGKELLCTLNHRMVTQYGKQTIRTILGMSSMQKSDSIQGEKPSLETARAGLCGLDRIAETCGNGGEGRESPISSILERENDCQESDEESRIKRENENVYHRITEKWQTPAIWRQKTGQRHGHDPIGVGLSQSVSVGNLQLCDSHLSNGGIGVSGGLQGGLCLAGNKSIGRYRRQSARYVQEETTGHQEGRTFIKAWLDLLQIDEPTDSLKSDPIVYSEVIASPSDLIYDIEIEQFHNYFVEGLLSSNSIASTYMNVFEYFGVFTNPKKLLVGVTATPNRGDKVGLAEVYQSIVFQRNLREMITAKWLCPITAYRIITGSDLTGVRIQHGDFVDADLAEAVNTPQRNQLAVDSYKAYCEGRRALVFCVDKNHTRDMADAFKRSGIPCGIVLGDTDTEERAYTLRQFAEGKIKVIANCMVLTEGYDLPTLSCIIMARPTKSGLLYTQCIGRGTRIHPEKENLIVIDLTDNSLKHQLISLPSLLGLPIEFAIQGKDVIETVDEFDRLQAKHPGVPLSEARSMEDIEKIIQKFDILKAASIDPNVANYSKFTWIATPDGFSIYISETKAQISIKENLLGKFDIAVSQPGTIMRMTAADSLEIAFRTGDMYLENHYPQMTGMFAQNARWRQDGATEPQTKLLTKLGINFPSGITKGQAAILISSHFAKSKVRY